MNIFKSILSGIKSWFSGLFKRAKAVKEKITTTSQMIMPAPSKAPEFKYVRKHLLYQSHFGTFRPCRPLAHTYRRKQWNAGLITIQRRISN